MVVIRTVVEFHATVHRIRTLMRSVGVNVDTVWIAWCTRVRVYILMASTASSLSLRICSLIGTYGLPA